MLLKTVKTTQLTNETEKTIGLSKKKLYQKLSASYLMPSFQSRAITRPYLVKAFLKEVYLVSKESIALFEAQNISSPPHRAPGFTVMQIVFLIDSFLSKMGKMKTGFKNGSLPDEDYCYRLARYLDQGNLLQIFFTGTPKAISLTFSAQTM